MPTPAWSHFPLAAAEPQGRSWLALLGNLGRSPATVDAYGRGLDQYGAHHKTGAAGRRGGQAKERFLVCPAAGPGSADVLGRSAVR